MHNVEIAWMLMEIADLSEIKGDGPFKARSYRKVARFLQRYPQNLASQEKKQLEEHLKQIPGVGKSIAGIIQEIIATGASKLLQELQQEIPSELRQLLAIPGLGVSKAGTIFRQLKITNLDQLEQAAIKRTIRQLPGMGGKTEQTILRGIKMLRQGGGAVPIGLGLAIAEEFSSLLSDIPGVAKVGLSGDIRLGLDLIEKVVLIILVEGHQEILLLLRNHPLIKEITKEGDGYFEAITWLGVYISFHFVSHAAYIPYLFYTTGSAEHWSKMEKLLQQKGYTIKEKEFLTDHGERLIIEDETKIYQIAGLPYIYPELRDNTGEIEAAIEDKLPKLIDRSDIKGDLHLHSNWSDGVNKISEIVDKARILGYEYIAITDHSKSLGIAKGLTEERLKKQQQEIAELNQQLPDCHILSGVEMDILSDGKLDYSDDILVDMDIVVASIHSGFKQERDTITQRIINAIKNQHVDIIAHPTGRLLGRREPYGVDLEKVLEMAEKYDTAVEINSSPDRLDLNAYWVRKAKKMGIKIAINTDAHDLTRMDEIRFGLGVGRKGWLQSEDVLNCWSYKELKKYLEKKR